VEEDLDKDAREENGSGANIYECSSQALGGRFACNFIERTDNFQNPMIFFYA
jgi:hypothetical protein